jgi:hypothetical protein
MDGHLTKQNGHNPKPTRWMQKSEVIWMKEVLGVKVEALGHEQKNL